MIEQRKAREFLACGRIAVVGASDDSKNFGGVVLRALVDHGIDAVPVHPGQAVVADRACYPSLADVPGEVDGVLVMLPPAAALTVIREAARRGVPRVWLFQGLGGPGAMSHEAIALSASLGVDVIAGACPMMFFEPVRGAHRVHRMVRRARKAVDVS